MKDGIEALPKLPAAPTALSLEVAPCSSVSSRSGTTES